MIRTDHPTLEDVLAGDTLVATSAEVEVPPGARTVVLTSGTTGEPKVVAHTQAMWEANAAGVREVLGVGEEDRWLLALPTDHVAGLSILIRASIWGTPVVTDGDCEWASLVPTQVVRGFDPPPSFRGAIVGGAPMPAQLPGWAIPAYGMTETCGMVWVGDRALPGAEFMTAADGELLVRGPMVAADGWLPTGDLGEVVDGRLAIRGRKKDLIITGGKNVSPLEVERVLEEHPGVREAAVAGVPDPEWGERVVAYVVGDTDGLREFARERLPGFKSPKEYRRVEELPRTASGKLLRNRLN